MTKRKTSNGKGQGNKAKKGNKTGKDKRFYKTMIPKADALYDDHLNNLQSQPKP
jgi:hypothetical protein